MTNVSCVDLVLLAAKAGEKVSRATLRSALRELDFEPHSMVKHEEFDGHVTGTRKWQTASLDFPFRVPCGDWDSGMVPVDKTKQAAEFFESITAPEAIAS